MRGRNRLWLVIAATFAMLLFGATFVVASHQFSDVATSSPFHAAISTVKQLNITSGCATNPPRYCPKNNVTREQMAAFLGNTARLNMSAFAVDFIGGTLVGDQPEMVLPTHTGQPGATGSFAAPADCRLHLIGNVTWYPISHGVNSRILLSLRFFVDGSPVGTAVGTLVDESPSTAPESFNQNAPVVAFRDVGTGPHTIELRGAVDEADDSVRIVKVSAVGTCHPFGPAGSLIGG